MLVRVATDILNRAANASRTIDSYLELAKDQTSNTAPLAVQGGSLGAAATGTPTGTSPSSTSTPGAANRGAVSWGLLGVMGLVGAAFV